jgi:ribonuclease P protein component
MAGLSCTTVDASGFRFARSSRLLTPADFKPVFDAAALKISSKEVLILARTNRHTSPRLGLVIAKKHVRQANQRNRVKRIVRESFRHQLSLGGWDIVVLARGGIAQFDNPALRMQLDQLWQQFMRKATKLRDLPLPNKSDAKPC